jgi:hypothetical protein
MAAQVVAVNMMHTGNSDAALCMQVMVTSHSTQAGIACVVPGRGHTDSRSATPDTCIQQLGQQLRPQAPPMGTYISMGTSISSQPKSDGGFTAPLDSQTGPVVTLQALPMQPTPPTSRVSCKGSHIASKGWYGGQPTGHTPSVHSQLSACLLHATTVMRIQQPSIM